MDMTLIYLGSQFLLIKQHHHVLHTLCLQNLLQISDLTNNPNKQERIMVFFITV
jgi:hypothetical protein